MRHAIAAIMIGAITSAATAATPSYRAQHPAPRGVHARVAPPARAAEPVFDRDVLAARPLPVIKAYFPDAYRQIADAANEGARERQSRDEIAGSVAVLSNAFLARMSPYYDTGNTIEYMVISRDLLKSMAVEAPDACADYLHGDARLGPAARGRLAAMMTRQPAWRLEVIEASLRQAATLPAKPVVGVANPMIMRAIRDTALQSVPETLRKYLRPVDGARAASPQESEANCRYTSGVITAILQLPPEQAAATFKRLNHPARGLWSVSERLIPVDGASGPMTMAAEFP